MPSVSKGEATAERILNAAFKSIAARGCSAVTLREIAQEAGVALSQLNYYYGNKDSLFTAVLRRMKLDYVGALDERLADCPSLVDRVGILVDHNHHMLSVSPDTYRNFLEFFNFGTNSEHFRQEVAGFLADIADLIESRISRHDTPPGQGLPVSTSVVTRFILSASFGIALQHLLNPGNTDVLAGFELIKAAAVRQLS